MTEKEEIAKLKERVQTLEKRIRKLCPPVARDLKGHVSRIYFTAWNSAPDRHQVTIETQHGGQFEIFVSDEEARSISERLEDREQVSIHVEI